LCIGTQNTWSPSSRMVADRGRACFEMPHPRPPVSGFHYILGEAFRRLLIRLTRPRATRSAAHSEAYPVNASPLHHANSCALASIPANVSSQSVSTGMTLRVPTQQPDILWSAPGARAQWLTGCGAGCCLLLRFNRPSGLGFLLILRLRPLPVFDGNLDGRSQQEQTYRQRQCNHRW